MAWEELRVIPGFAIIGLAVYAIYHRAEVRLTLLLAALALGTLAGEPMSIVRKFLVTFTDEKFVVPLCTALGFAYVLRHTQCDQHLVHLLMQPLRRARFFLIPGTVVVGFLVNIPIVSQTSTAVTLGTVVVPLLLNNELFGERVTLFDVKLAKNIRFAGRRLSLGVDIYKPREL